MLSWLRIGNTDHPLEDKSEARRFVEALRDKTDIAALEEVAQQLDSIKMSDALRPMRAFEIVELLDRTARPFLRSLTTQYVAGAEKLTRFKQHRAWFTATSFLTQLSEGYRTCLSRFEVGAVGATTLKPHLPKICGRAIRANAAQVKWSLLHYSQVDPELWEQIARVYASAEAGSFAPWLVTMYRGERGESSVAREFLRALMLGVCAPDALLPIQIELADRIIARCADAFELSSAPHKTLRHTIDLSAPLAPGRRKSAPGNERTPRFFGAGEAAARIATWKAELEHSAAVPVDLNLGLEIRAPVLLDTLEHLTHHWALTPERKQIRRRRQEQISVVHEYAEVVANVGALFLESPFVSNDEQWSLENTSANGLGARVPKAAGDWIQVGSLIGVLRKGRSAWAPAIIRRISGDVGGQRNVGIELLAEGGAAVTVFAVKAVRGSPVSAEGELCVLLASSSKRTDEAKLLLRPGIFTQGRELEMHAYDRRYLLKPATILKSGDDFELARFRVQALDQ